MSEINMKKGKKGKNGENEKPSPIILLANKTGFPNNLYRAEFPDEKTFLHYLLFKDNETLTNDIIVGIHDPDYSQLKEKLSKSVFREESFQKIIEYINNHPSDDKIIPLIYEMAFPGFRATERKTNNDWSGIFNINRPTSGRVKYIIDLVDYEKFSKHLDELIMVQSNGISNETGTTNIDIINLDVYFKESIIHKYEKYLNSDGQKLAFCFINGVLPPDDVETYFKINYPQAFPLAEQDNSISADDEPDEDVEILHQETVSDSNPTIHNANIKPQSEVSYPLLLDNNPIDADESTVIHREQEFEEILNIIDHKKAGGVLLHGMAGNGKTSIAQVIFNKLRKRKEYSQYWFISYNKDLQTSMAQTIRISNYSDTSSEADLSKKWHIIEERIKQHKKKTLLVIDNVDFINGVQDPKTDKTLHEIANWENFTVIITSRLPQIKGYLNRYTIHELGMADSEGKAKEYCADLFYHYNSNAEEFRTENEDTVNAICELASYNTLIVEILAGSSRKCCDSTELKRFYENLKAKGFRYINKRQVATNHDSDDMQNKSGLFQLMSLFNIHDRTESEKTAIWAFHLVPEAFSVSEEELEEWLGLDINAVDELEEEGWIKYQSGRYSIHPLIRQAISCSEILFEESVKNYMINSSKTNLISMVIKQEFFSEEDDYERRIRKITFVDALSLSGEILDAPSALYVADYARKEGARDISLRLYKNAFLDLSAKWRLSPRYTEYFPRFIRENLPQDSKSVFEWCSDRERIISLNVNEKNIEQAWYLWRALYYYGYLLSYYSIRDYDNSLKLLLLSYCLLNSMAYVCLSDINNKEQINKYLKNFAKTVDHLGYVILNYKIEDWNWVGYAYLFLNLALLIRNTELSSVLTYPLWEPFVDGIFKPKDDIVKPEDDDIISILKDIAWSKDNLGMFFASINSANVPFYFINPSRSKDTIIVMLSPNEKERHFYECKIKISDRLTQIIDIEAHRSRMSLVSLYNQVMVSKRIKEEAKAYLTSALCIREKISLLYSGVAVSWYDELDNFDYKLSINSEIPWTLCNLGILLSQDSNTFDEAELFLKLSLSVYEELGRKNSEEHLSSIERIGKAYQALLYKRDGVELEVTKCLEKLKKKKIDKTLQEYSRWKLQHEHILSSIDAYGFEITEQLLIERFSDSDCLDKVIPNHTQKIVRDYQFFIYIKDGCKLEEDECLKKLTNLSKELEKNKDRIAIPSSKNIKNDEV